MISLASFYEIAQRIRLGKWPAKAAGTLEWAHHDPFDRILAATALNYRAPIISADPIFDEIVTRIR